MLGHLDSPAYLGAVALGANLIALLYWMFAFLRMGTTALTGQAYGAGSALGISLQFVQASALALILALVLVLLKPWVIPLGLAYMVDDASLRTLSQAYCDIRIFSAPAVFLNYVILGWLIGLQNARIPLVITVLANLLNLLLDYIFIVELGWAHQGAALATLIAEYTSLVLGVASLFLYYRKYFNFRWQVIFSALKPLQTLTLNADLFVRTTLLLLVFNFLMKQSAAQGEVVLAVNAIILQLMLFVAFALDGYAHAAESMVAEAKGAKHVRQLHRASLAASLPAIVIAAGLSLLFLFAAQPLLSIMTDQLEIRAEALKYFYWLSLLPLVSVGCYMLDGIFIGASQTRIMLYLMLISTLLVFFPFWWLLSGYNNHGLWAAFTLFNFSRTTMMTMAYYFLSRFDHWI